MIQKAVLNKDLSDKEIYESILPVIDSLIAPGEPVISVLSNITAVIKESFGKVSWIGFYLLKEEKLYLGPFQGKLACTVIPAGKGVCGTSLVKKKTLIVDDVDKFEGHIACDSESRSEIVVPILKGETAYGVIDLDSTSYSSFNETDRFYIEKIAEMIAAKIDLEILKNIII